MKISYNWLKQFININWPAEKTGELLTDLGLEIEGIEAYESVQGGLKGVVVGEVLTCIQHPNADRLKVTTVNIGEKQPLQIVCGAPNVATGQKVPVATIGTTLYSPEGEAWTINKGKIRGEVSEGMICAEDELGLGASHEGIMILDAALKPGTSCSELFKIENDQVFEIGLTPNRADAMSHFGVARDLKAGLLQKEIQLELITPSVSAFHVDNRALKIDIDVKDTERCPRYCGLTISGIKVTDSPQWLQNRLKAIGLKPINNVVDITNYVLHELGQPLHAFDASKIKGNKVVVKTLKPGTKFTTLDGIERELHEEDLMICDNDKPMCIAGVFGGIESGVTTETNSVFLESAYFSPVSIRKTAKRHGLSTDASFRFERGIDPNITEYALKRAALLIVEVTGGKISSDALDYYPKKIEDCQVRLNFENTKNLIGEELPKETIKSILASLEIKVNNVTETGLGLTIPAYRNDVTREADVIEEILRVYGYNNIITSEKLNASVSSASKYEDYKLQQIIGNQLVSQGYYEIMTNSLTHEKHVDFDDNLKTDHNVHILNPLSAELGILRQSLLFSGLEAVAHNLNRKQADLKLFEFGKTYHKFTDNYTEYKHLGLFVTGNKTGESWTNPSKPSDFFYFKGIIEGVLTRLGIVKTQSVPTGGSIFSEGLALTLNRQTIVEFGLVKPSVLKQFGITTNVLYADFNWDILLKLSQDNQILFKAIPKYPEVRRDFALLLDKAVNFESVYYLAFKTEKELLKKVNLFDVYEGKNLPDGKKSYALSFTIQDERKTLTDKQIDKIMNKLKSNFEQELGAELR
jgi:phenylalanyl-tRNA synthetase beta chain